MNLRVHCVTGAKEAIPGGGQVHAALPVTPPQRNFGGELQGQLADGVLTKRIQKTGNSRAVAVRAVALAPLGLDSMAPPGGAVGGLGTPLRHRRSGPVCYSEELADKGQGNLLIFQLLMYCPR